MPAEAQAAIAEVSSVSDMDVTRAIAAGDHEAFRSLMRRHGSLLYRAARSIVSNDCGAEDAVQRGYIRAYGKMSTFDGGSALSTWLVRIVIEEARAATKPGRN